MKSTDAFQDALVKDAAEIAFPVYVRDLLLWHDEIYPVVFVIYDAQQERAYWSYVQRDVPQPDESSLQLTQTIRVLVENHLTEASFSEFATWLRELGRI